MTETSTTRRRGRASSKRRDGSKRKTSIHEGPVLITGNCGRLGRRLTRYLHRERQVIGIDSRPFVGKPKDVTQFRVDLRRKKTRDVFRSHAPSALVHMGIMHDVSYRGVDHHKWNVLAFQKLLEYVAAYEIPKLVLLSGAGVYGPSPDNAQFLSEDAPLLGSANFSALRDLVEVDMLAQSFFWKSPKTETVILRPVHILGSVRNASSNYLRLRPIPRLLGFDPMMQVIHQDDVVRAIVQALQPGIRGIFNIAGPPPVPLSRLIEMTGNPAVSIPYALARPTLHRMWKLGLSSFPAPELDHIRFVCMVDDSRARKVMNFNHQYDEQEAVDAVFAWE